VSFISLSVSPTHRPFGSIPKTINPPSVLAKEISAFIMRHFTFFVTVEPIGAVIFHSRCRDSLVSNFNRSIKIAGSSNGFGCRANTPSEGSFLFTPTRFFRFIREPCEQLGQSSLLIPGMRERVADDCRSISQNFLQQVSRRPLSRG